MNQQQSDFVTGSVWPGLVTSSCSVMSFLLAVFQASAVTVVATQAAVKQSSIYMYQVIIIIIRQTYELQCLSSDCQLSPSPASDSLSNVIGDHR